MGNSCGLLVAQLLPAPEVLSSSLVIGNININSQLNRTDENNEESPGVAQFKKIFCLLFGHNFEFPLKRVLATFTTTFFQPNLSNFKSTI